MENNIKNHEAKMKFLEECRNMFPAGERKTFSAEERLERLGIDPNARKSIEALPFERVCLDDDEYSLVSEEVISTSSIVGINRQDNVSNWIECLLNLHKQRHFELFVNRVAFEELLLPAKNSREDLPEVIEHDGKIYISTNGKHRLTFAKCLGIAEVRVVISRKPDVKHCSPACTAGT